MGESGASEENPWRDTTREPTGNWGRDSSSSREAMWPSDVTAGGDNLSLDVIKRWESCGG